jgi:Rrf2 family nitric oxide-sensitive transcriptional repressor
MADMLKSSTSDASLSQGLAEPGAETPSLVNLLPFGINPKRLSMRLARATDFSLRILMLLAGQKDDKPIPIDEIATRLEIARTHAMKIVAKLARHGLVTAHRGRSGGVVLAIPAAEIRIGEVVRLFESDFHLVDCLQEGGTHQPCVFLPRCALKSVIVEATNAFLASLDSVTLEDVAHNSRKPRTPREVTANTGPAQNRG